MAEYISREALRDALYEADAITMEGVKILNQFPAADVEPVRHAHWNYRCPIDGNSYRYCSKCLSAVYDSVLYVSKNYCPNCGAKMDDEVSE